MSTSDNRENPQAKLNEKRAASLKAIGAFAGASAAVAALPLPIKDALMLVPIELTEINVLARIYDIPQDESIRSILDALVQLGAASVAARSVLRVFEAQPRLILSSSARSAAIAALIVASVGALSAGAFDQVYLGKLSFSELGAVQSITLEVRKSNTAAIALYEGFGFEKAGERRGFYSKPTEDAIIMTKVLNGDS